MIIYYTDKFTGGREESRRLLEKAVAVHTGDEERAKRLIGALETGEHGKPYIEGFSCFSISHTGSIWAVLVADRECGLDIQHGRKCDMQAIAERWFAPEDALSITAPGTDSSETYDTFFRIWARREALTKALGGTVYDTDLPPVSGDDVMTEGSRYMIQDIQITDMPEIYAALCVRDIGSMSEISFMRI